MLVDSDEVKSLLPKKITRFLSQNEASKRMGLTGKIVSALAEAGHLPTTIASVPGGHHPVRAISPEDADAFVARYVTLAQASAELALGGCLRISRKIIEAKGARPVFDPEVVGCRIYEREIVGLARRGPVSSTSRAAE